MFYIQRYDPYLYVIMLPISARTHVFFLTPIFVTVTTYGYYHHYCDCTAYVLMTFIRVPDDIVREPGGYLFAKNDQICLVVIFG